MSLRRTSLMDANPLGSASPAFVGQLAFVRQQHSAAGFVVVSLVLRGSNMEDTKMVVLWIVEFVVVRVVVVAVL